MSEDYDDEENQNVIIDCDILEAAKENIQPLAGGRRVTALASVLATPHGLRNTRLEATKARLRERVREAQARVDRLRVLKDQEDKGDDKEDKGEGSGDEHEDDEEELTFEEAEEVLLDAYVRLVTWTVEHYPRGQSAHSGILELLEEATRVMRHSEHAKADARYLNLWIRYGTYVDHPEVIYQFLLANEIGTKWAKLYEEYASILEKINRRPKADEIYLLGIARKAEPLDHLEKRHRDFQKRMMVAAPVLDPDSSASQPAATPAPCNVGSRRRVLADSTSTSTTSSTLTPLTSTSSTFDVFSVPSSASSLASLGSQSKPCANGKIPVFVDPTGEAESAPGNAWPELGTRAERVKENRLVPEKMQGTVLKQRGAAKAATKEAIARARAAPKIEVFKDPELPVAAPKTSNGNKFVPFKDPELESHSAPFDTSVKIVPYKDPEPSSNASSSKTKIEVFKDPEPPAAGSSSGNRKKFIPFKDPELQTSTSSSDTKITVFRDPEPAPAPSGSRKTDKFVPFKHIGPAPRRSSRLNSKIPARNESEPLPETTEDNVKVKPAASASFVPFKDEDVGQGAKATSSVSETVMRPKVLGGGGLGIARGTSEAEALRKDPFKNYKDL